MTTTNHIRYAIGADIGGSHICSAVVDLQKGTLLTEPVTTDVDCHAEALDIIEAWAENLHLTASSSTVPVGCAGLAIPGPFDYIKGISLIAGVNKFDSIFGLDVSLSLKSLLSGSGIDKIRFVNDASAFALGESLGGAASDVDRVVALTLGTGVGSGFVSGHRLVEDGPTVPANGWVYCLPFGDGIADEAFSTRWLINRYRQLTGTVVDGGREIAEKCAYEPEARMLFEEYGRRLAEFTLPLLRQFGSHTLILGGNISRAYPHFGHALESEMSRSGYNVDIKVSSLLDKAALIGAASLFI